MREHRLDRGISLVEALLVVALVGIAAAVIIGLTASTYRTYRLRSAVTEIESFVQATYTEAGSLQAPAFLRLESHVSPRQLVICRDLACTQRQRTLPIPDFVSLSISSVAETTCNWPVDGSVFATPPVRVLACDTMGRTFDPTSNTPVAAVQTLVVTHKSMVEGGSTPRTRYVIQVFPLWKASHRMDTW